MTVRFAPHNHVLEYFTCDGCGCTRLPESVRRCHPGCSNLVCPECDLCSDCTSSVCDIVLCACTWATRQHRVATESVGTTIEGTAVSGSLPSAMSFVSSNNSDDIAQLTMATTCLNQQRFCTTPDRPEVVRKRLVKLRVRADANGGVIITKLVALPRRHPTIASRHTKPRVHFDYREPISIGASVRARRRGDVRVSLRLTRGTTRL